MEVADDTHRAKRIISIVLYSSYFRRFLAFPTQPADAQRAAGFRHSSVGHRALIKARAATPVVVGGRRARSRAHNETCNLSYSLTSSIIAGDRAIAAVFRQRTRDTAVAS